VSSVEVLSDCMSHVLTKGALKLVLVEHGTFELANLKVKRVPSRVFKYDRVSCVSSDA
jgi:hypothetical protein